MGHRGPCPSVLTTEVTAFLGLGRVGAGRSGRWVGTCIHLSCTGPCRADRLHTLSGQGAASAGPRECAGLGVRRSASPPRGAWGGGHLFLIRAPSPLQAEAAVAAVAVADTVRDGPPTIGPDGVSKTWGRGGACTAALVTPAPGAPAGGSTGPSAAASFFSRYVLWGLLNRAGPGPGAVWTAWTRTVGGAEDLGSWPR